MDLKRKGILSMVILLGLAAPGLPVLGNEPGAAANPAQIEGAGEEEIQREGGRRRGVQSWQTAILEAWCRANLQAPYPQAAEKGALAAEAQLTVEQVANWFINFRICRWRALQLEMNPGADPVGVAFATAAEHHPG